MKKIFYRGGEYILIGECKMCGECCKGLNYFMNNKNEVIKVSKCNNICKHLKNSKCNIHDNKKKLCKVYPSLYEELKLFPNCGYKWKKVRKIHKKNTRLILNEDMFK